MRPSSSWAVSMVSRRTRPTTVAPARASMGGTLRIGVREPIACLIWSTSSKKESRTGPAASNCSSPERARLDRHRGHVLDANRLQQVVAAAGNEKERKAAQAPGDVADQDVAGAEHERGSDDDPRESGGPERLLDLGLAAKVGSRELGDELETPRWTTRRTPARLAATSSLRVLATAVLKLTSALGERIQ